MLRQLDIQNYTLIKELSIPFYDGLSIITGETGAGKSILLGALKLVLGERADYSIFHEDAKKCTIEATFELDNKFEVFFIENELEYAPLTIIRREIHPDGKSRAFINDSPVRLQILQSLSSQLIDIHSQFENENLFSKSYQFNFLDNYAHLQSDRRNYLNRFNEYEQKKSELELWKNNLQEQLKNRDYNQFLYRELEEVDLEKFDLQESEEELKQLENAESIQEGIGQLQQLMTEENQGIEALLNLYLQTLRKLSEKSPKLNFLLERFESAKIELEDIASDLESFGQDVVYEPEKIEVQHAKVNHVQSLLQKHQVASVSELQHIKNTLSFQESDLEGLENRIAERHKELEGLEKNLRSQAKELHEKRKATCPALSQYVESLLSEVGLEKARFSMHLDIKEEMDSFGMDNIAILFSANTGIPLQDISQAISGGERSRLMLVLKKVAAENAQLATLILDEIDTGVSGKIAYAIGNIMQEMAKDMQLIVITHLAQIAAKGNYHYKVYKQEANGETHTYIERLNPEHRIKEIASLISGENVSEASILQAKELLKTQ